MAFQSKKVKRRHVQDEVDVTGNKNPRSNTDPQIIDLTISPRRPAAGEATRRNEIAASASTSSGSDASHLVKTHSKKKRELMVIVCRPVSSTRLCDQCRC